MREAKEEDPQLVAIQKAIPSVCDRLRTMMGVLQTGLEGNDASIQREERIVALENVVKDFCSGVFSLSFTPGNRSLGTWFSASATSSPSSWWSLLWADACADSD